MNQSKYNNPSSMKTGTNNTTNNKNGPEPRNVNGGIISKKVLENGTYLTRKLQGDPNQKLLIQNITTFR